MTQQEIKANMTNGTWIVSPTNWSDIEFGVYDKEKYAFGTFVVGSCNSNFYELGVSNTLAITHAINNTYGNGINPESVSEMYNALVMVVGELDGCNMSLTAKLIQDILNKSTL